MIKYLSFIRDKLFVICYNKNYKSEERIWEYKGKSDEKIRRISGDKLYEIITGDSDALEKTFNAIPKAIVDLLGDEYKLNEKDNEILKEYNEYIFG